MKAVRPKTVHRVPLAPVSGAGPVTVSYTHLTLPTILLV